MQPARVDAAVELVERYGGTVEGEWTDELDEGDEGEGDYLEGYLVRLLILCATRLGRVVVL